MLARQIKRQTHILRKELMRKASGLVIPPGKDHAWKALVQHREPTGKAAAYGLPEDAQVHACFHAKSHRFGNYLRKTGAHQLMHQLADGASSQRAAIDNLVAIGFKNRVDAVEGLL